MSYAVDEYYTETVARAPASARATFIKRTYLHVFGAIVALVAVEAVLIGSGLAEQLLRDVFFASRLAWPATMVVFMVGTFAAQYMARSRRSVGMQYAGLALYVLLYALVFMPLLTLASLPKFGGTPELPLQAGLVTLLVFGGLTAAVFLSGKEFTFLGPVLAVGSLAALGVIVASMVFGFSLGLVFAGAMVALFAGFIVYDTSNIIHRYGTGEYVAAAMALFGSIAMLFYYILMIFMSARRD